MGKQKWGGGRSFICEYKWCGEEKAELKEYMWEENVLCVSDLRWKWLCCGNTMNQQRESHYMAMKRIRQITSVGKWNPAGRGWPWILRMSLHPHCIYKQRGRCNTCGVWKYIHHCAGFKTAEFIQHWTDVRPEVFSYCTLFGRKLKILQVVLLWKTILITVKLDLFTDTQLNQNTIAIAILIMG